MKSQGLQGRKGIYTWKCDCRGHKEIISPNDCVCSPDDAEDLSKCKQYQEPEAKEGWHELTVGDIEIWMEKYQLLHSHGAKLCAIKLLLAQQKKDTIEEIKELKCKVPKKPTKYKELTEEFATECVIWAGRFNYNKAIDDVLDQLLLAPKK